MDLWIYYLLILTCTAWETESMKKLTKHLNNTEPLLFHIKKSPLYEPNSSDMFLWRSHLRFILCKEKYALKSHFFSYKLLQRSTISRFNNHWHNSHTKSLACMLFFETPLHLIANKQLPIAMQVYLWSGLHCLPLRSSELITDLECSQLMSVVAKRVTAPQTVYWC